MDVSKSFWDGERNFLKMKEKYKVFCLKVFLADLLGSQHLFEIIQISLTVKNSENMVKSRRVEANLPF